MSATAGLSDLLAEKTPAWHLRVTLMALRQRGWPFDKAWASAIQRLRVQPHMTQEQAEELAEYKEILGWARPVFEYHYNCQETTPAPRIATPDEQLADLQMSPDNSSGRNGNGHVRAREDSMAA